MYLAILMLHKRLLAPWLFGRVAKLKMTEGLPAVKLIGWDGVEGLAGRQLLESLMGIDFLQDVVSVCQ